MPESSIVITTKESFSSAITTMRNANQHFNKDLEGTQKKLDAFNKTKISLKIDTDKAKKELQAAEKQFAKTGDAADKLKLEMANQNYENANRNLKLVSSNAKQAEKDILSLTNSTSKAENRAESGNGTSGTSTLATSGITALVGSALSGIANTYVSSAYGSDAGTVSGSTLTGAAMGAAMGSIVPGIGTAVGAAVGGLVGAIQGLTEVYEKQDDSFKEYYKGLYDTVTQAQEDSLTNGSTIASSRETTRLSFKTLLGSDAASADYTKSLQSMAASTPFELDDLTAIGKTLLAYHYSTDESLQTMSAIGEAGSALGLDASSMKDMATYLGRMKVTGKTTMEYLNPLLERGIDIYSALSQLPAAAGKTNEQIQEMVSKGLIPGAEAAKAISDYMETTYAGSMVAQSKTFAGLTSTLADAKAELDNAMGEGYNDSRKVGMQNEIDFYGGDNGAEMQGAYNAIGQYKASLENQKEQLQRDALQSVMTGTIAKSYANSDQKAELERLIQEYETAKADYNAATGDTAAKNDTAAMEEAGAKMGAALAEAQAIATNEYNAGDGAQMALQSQLDLAERIKNDSALNENYYDAGYIMGQQFTKGLASAVEDTAPTIVGGRQVYSSKGRSGSAENDVGTGFGFSPKAFGMHRVPYDNFPALLHEDERVLTAAEARSYGKSPVVQVTGNSFVVREETDIDKIASALVSKIYAAQMLSID